MSDIVSGDTIFYNHYQIFPVDSIWQRQKCKELLFTYISDVIYESETFDKTLDIRKLVPSKEKRISPDGNCLFSSLSFIITGSDHYHKEIRELLITNMKINIKPCVQIIAPRTIIPFQSFSVILLKNI